MLHGRNFFKLLSALAKVSELFDNINMMLIFKRIQIKIKSFNII
ncbi:hypothetical protein HMPREF9554_02764 [Treponema phagedenis F0421]|nr:hypothetical protein HMPREF9554_02764 [Treponema phagedenis F0421]